MLPESHRLRQRQVFPRVYRRGQRQSGSLVTLTWLSMDISAPSLDPPVSQFAVVVSKKTSRQAVERNRIRRRLQAALYPLLPKIRPGFWVVLSGRYPVLCCPWPQIQQEVQRLLTRAQLLGNGKG